MTVVPRFDSRGGAPIAQITAKDAKGAKQRCLAPLASLAVSPQGCVTAASITTQMMQV